MKILHLIMIVIFATIFITNTGVVSAQYGPGFSPVEHYPTINDTELKLSVINSTEFKERTTGYNYTLAGIDHNWISKGNNYYDFGGARITFFVSGFSNGTTKGEAFNLDSQMKIKNVFEYDGDNPPAGYYVDRCMGCLLTTGAKPQCCGPAYVLPTLDTPLKQFKSGVAAKDVKCKQGLQFIMKNENGQPACVTPHTFDELITRGWGIIPLGGLPTHHNMGGDIVLSYNYTLYENGAFHVTQGENFTLMLNVTTDPSNVPVTLYAAPHSGFTKTNGIDFKLSDTKIITPAKVMLYMLVSKDAIPSTYGESIRLNGTDGMELVTYTYHITVAGLPYQQFTHGAH